MTTNTEGAEYIVLGSVDLIVDEGIAVGDPRDEALVGLLRPRASVVGTMGLSHSWHQSHS